MAWISEIKGKGQISGVDIPCRVWLPVGKPYFTEPGGTSYPLPYDFPATAIGIIGTQGVYLLNDGGFRFFNLADVAAAEPLGGGDAAQNKLARIATANAGVLQGARAIKRMTEE